MSDSPYKGIPGGDPKFRAEHLKTLVLIAYICPSCNQEKSEKFPAGKDLAGRICIDCRNTESARKSLEYKEQMEQYAETERLASYDRPIRTEEEKLALIEEWNHTPREHCCSCGGDFFIGDPKMPFYNDDFYRPNAISTVHYGNNPLLVEIHDEKVPNWFCGRCYYEISLDI